MLILTSAASSAWLSHTSATAAMRVVSPTMQLHHQQQTYAVPRDAVARAEARGTRGGMTPTRYGSPNDAAARARARGDMPLPPTPNIRSTAAPGVVAAPQSPAHDAFIRVDGGSIRTWKYMSPNVEQVQVLLTTEGRPLDADVELWNGPGNIPAKMRVYVEDGQLRPFKAVIATPRGPSTVAIQNVGELEFPFDAQVVAENVANPSPECRESAKNLQGGATRSYQFEAAVDSVQVLLFSEGMPLNARIELIQGPNNNRQVIELYTDDGADRPFFCFIETPGPGSVVRVINTAPLAYPLKTGVIPHSVGQGSPYEESFFDDVVVVGGQDEMRLDRYTQRARQQQHQHMQQHQQQQTAVERARRQQAVQQQQMQQTQLAMDRAAAMQREAAARAQQQQAAERAAAVQRAASQAQQQAAADRAAAMQRDAARAGQAAGRAAAAAQAAGQAAAQAQKSMMEVRDAAVRSAWEARSAYERHMRRAERTAAPPAVAGPTSAVAASETPPLSEYEKYLSRRGRGAGQSTPAAPAAAATPPAASEPSEYEKYLASRGQAAQAAPAAPAAPVAAEPSEYEKYIARRGVAAGPEVPATSGAAAGAAALSREEEAKRAWLAKQSVAPVASSLRGAPAAFAAPAVPAAPSKQALSYEQLMRGRGMGANFGRG